MNHLVAYIFPNTLPNEAILFPLVQVFGTVVYCQPIENDPIMEETSSFIKDLLDTKRLKLLFPAPLGDHRNRFLSLVADLHNRRDDYAAQLSGLALAGLGAAKGTIESKHSIMDQLLKKNDIEDNSKDEMLLWQARLVLKLGELYDAEQVGLTDKLHKLAARQNDLFSELREETSNPFSLTDSLNVASGHPDGMIRHRLKAWARLFCLGNEPLPQQDFFVTTSADALDTLQSIYEHTTGQEAQPLMRLTLPAAKSPLKVPMDQTPLLSLATEETGKVQLFLSNLAQKKNIEENWSDDFHNSWENLLDTSYPVAGYGRCQLSLYSFEDISSSQLFMESFAKTDNLIEAKAATRNNILVALLEQNSAP